MTLSKSVKRPANRRGVRLIRPRLVGVIASRLDLKRALQMRNPPDLFELRLDCLAPHLAEIEMKFAGLRAPLIITARDPREGGANSLSVNERRKLLVRFLPQASYIDIELRSARAFRAILEQARRKKVGRIVSFHSVTATPASRSLHAKARRAKSLGADVFKVATRTDTLPELNRLTIFLRSSPARPALSVMGIGKLGAVSRILLAHRGSVLNYASLYHSNVEGQLPIQRLRLMLAR